MLKWLDVIKYANKGNLTPDRRVVKTDGEWKDLLTEEQYLITRQKEQKKHIVQIYVLFLKLESTHAYVVTHCFLIRQKNLIVAQVGLHLHNR